MRLKAGRSQHSYSPSKWLVSPIVCAVFLSFSRPAAATTLVGMSGSPWVTATIISVAAVLALWVASMGLSALSLKMRWVSRHRHNRLTRGLQVVYGGLLITAMMMPYLAMHHPVVAAGLLLTAVLAMLVMGTRNRQLQSDSN